MVILEVASSLEQLEESMDALNFKLTKEQIRYLEIGEDD